MVNIKMVSVLVLIWLISSIILVYTAFLLLDSQYEAKKSSFLESRLDIANIQYEMLSNGYSMHSHMIFKQVINSQEVAALMHKAVLASPSKKVILRQKLFKKFQPLYQDMQKQNLRQMHFHLPNSISFLRMHRPEYFGDDLTGIRPSIKRVNSFKKMVTAFEVGPIFNAIRHVFPIFYKKRFVGTVEISYGFEAFVQSSLTLSGERFYHFILKKNLLSDKVWKSEKHSYIRSRLDEGYVYDINVYERYNRQYFDVEDRGHMFSSLEGEIEDELESAKTFVKAIVYQGHHYSVVFKSVLNLSQEHVAYFLTVKKASDLDELKSTYLSYRIVATMVAILIGLLISLLFWMISYRFYWLRHMAHTDNLTKIPNRAFLYKQLPKLLEHAHQQDKALSCIFCDIDYFKQINDTFGHDVGDRVLKTLANIVDNNLRKDDFFARWGGEEFMILLPNTALKESVHVANKLCEAISSYHFSHGGVTCSFGVVSLNRGEKLNSFIKRADNALYQAKKMGRNCVKSEDDIPL